MCKVKVSIILQNLKYDNKYKFLMFIIFTILFLNYIFISFYKNYFIIIIKIKSILKNKKY